MQKNWIAVLALSGAIAFVPAISSAQLTDTEKGTGVGVLVGGGTGAIVGAAVHHPIAGTLIGAGVGGVGGYAVGHHLQQEDEQNAMTQRELRSQRHEIEEQRREIQQLQQDQDTE
ncbi:MAG TPA: glycine zipper domain-containing protein [Candidatus Binataceae bacterium]|jgi:phage tail tape-measure protein